MSKLPFLRRLTRAALAVAVGVAAATPPASLHAATFTYIGPNNGFWFTPSNWGNNPPPFAVPPPGPGDFARITSNRDVILDGNVNDLGELLLSNHGDLLTNDFRLEVTNNAGTAEANIVGTGVMGNNTELFAQSNGFLDAVRADILNLSNGAEMDLIGDARVRIMRRLDVDGLSLVNGNGIIRFDDAHNVTGKRFDNEGVIRPDGNDRITLIAESGTIDLDGSNGTGDIDLSAVGSELVVSGPLSDAISSSVEMVRDSLLSVNEAWSFGSAGGAAATIDISAGPGTATISGGPLTFGGYDTNDTLLTAANLNVNVGTGHIDTDVTFWSATDVNIADGAVLRLGDNATFRGGSYTGAGTLIPAAQNHVHTPTTIDVDTIDFDAGDWTIGEDLVLNVERLDTTLTLHEGLLLDNYFDSHTIRVDANDIGPQGRLEVNLNPPGLAGQNYWALGSSATLDLNGTNAPFAASPMLAGSPLHVYGDMDVERNVRVSAPLNVREGGQVNLIGADAELTLEADAQMSGGSIVGAGDLRSTSATLSGHGHVVTDVNFSNTSEIWADNGLLRLAGNLDDLGAYIGTADDDGVLQIEDSNFHTDIVGEVRLNGGAWIDGPGMSFVQNVGNGTIRGHGSINVESINNHSTIAAEGGTLEIHDRLDWDGSSVGALGNEGDGVLSARLGNLVVRQMYQGPSFVGTIATAGNHSFTYDSGAASDTILFDDPTGDDDAGNDRGRLYMVGGALVTDRVLHEGEFVIQQAPSTIEATQIVFRNEGSTQIESELRLATSGVLPGTYGTVISSGASFSGAGSLVNTSSSPLEIIEGADLDTDLINEGVLNIGTTLNGFGWDNTAGIELRSFEQSASGDVVFELEGIALDEFDRLDASDAAVLSGDLIVDVINGFSPLAGETFEIITAGGDGVMGMFDSIMSSGLTGDLYIEALYNPNNVMLQVSTPYSADFDMDGDVDHEDLDAWQNSKDRQGSGFNFLEWQQQLGSGTGKVAEFAAVPEPSTIALMLVSTASMLLRRGKSASAVKQA